MTDARDIVERLRNFAINTLAIIPEKIERHPKTDPELIVAGFSRQCDMATEAANEIASLRKQLEDARSIGLVDALGAMYFYVHATDLELEKVGMNRTDALIRARRLRVEALKG